MIKLWWTTRSVAGDALTGVEQIAEESARARALARLAPYLPEELLQDAIGTAHGIRDELDCIEAWVGIAPYLPEPRREWAWRRALLAASNVSEPSLLVNWRALALRKLVPDLPETMLTQALRIAQSIAEAYRAIQDVGRWWP